MAHLQCVRYQGKNGLSSDITMPEEAQPRNITRANLVLTEGFGLHFSP
jgi:hypothetical protein